MKGKGRVGGPFGEHVRLRRTVFRGQIEIKRRVPGIGRPCCGRGKLRAKREWQACRIRRRFNCCQRLIKIRIRRSGGSRREAARTHDVNAAEDIGIFHGDAGSAVAAHGMASQAAAGASGNGAVMRINRGNEIVSNEAFEVAGGDGTGIHGAAVESFGIGQHHDHFLGSEREGAFNGLRNVNFVRPLLGADGIAVQRVDHGIAAGLAGGITGR